MREESKTTTERNKEASKEEANEKRTREQEDESTAERRESIKERQVKMARAMPKEEDDEVRTTLNFFHRSSCTGPCVGPERFEAPKTPRKGQSKIFRGAGNCKTYRFLFHVGPRILQLHVQTRFFHLSLRFSRSLSLLRERNRAILLPK